jgi:hypothetical protein
VRKHSRKKEEIKMKRTIMIETYVKRELEKHTKRWRDGEGERNKDKLKR